MKIIGNHLAENVAKWLNEDYFPTTERTFPDGELCPRFESAGHDTAGETAALILQKKAGENVNDYLMNYFFILSAIKDAGFARVIACMPYFAYARQHKQYLPGQPVSAMAVSRTLEFHGIDHFITVNTHEPSYLPKLFSVPVTDLSAMSLLAEYISKKKEYADAAIVAPDDGAEHIAMHMSKLLGGRDYTVFEKNRDIRTGDIKQIPKNAGILKGRSVIVVDDMVSSGQTMVETIRACTHHGATRTAAVFVHPVFSGNAHEKLRACCDEIITTNTIASDASNVDVSPIIAQALREITKKK